MLRTTIITAALIATTANAGEKECGYPDTLSDYSNSQIEQSCGAHTKTNRNLKIVIIGEGEAVKAEYRGVAKARQFYTEIVPQD
ncbi:MAG: hypothetical protein ACPGGK_13025 [Pikeienuella sp.]